MYQQDNSTIKGILSMELAANFMLGYFTFRSIMKRRVIRSFLWGSAALFLNYGIRKNMLILSKVIVAIHLHESGKKATFTFIDGKRLVSPIEEVVRLSEGAY